MVNTELSLISDLIDAIDKAYDLILKISADLKDSLQKKNKKKTTKQIENLRDVVGQIDSIFTKFKNDLQILEMTNQTDKYKDHFYEFCEAFKKINDLTGSLYHIHSMSYFHKFPNLRENLYLKIALEEHFFIHPEICFTPDGRLDYPSYSRFKLIIDYICAETRGALVSLNEHLDTGHDASRKSHWHRFID